MYVAGCIISTIIICAIFNFKMQLTILIVSLCGIANASVVFKGEK